MVTKTAEDLVGVFSRVPLGREFEAFLEFAEFTQEAGSARIYRIPRAKLAAALARGGQPLPKSLDR